MEGLKKGDYVLATKYKDGHGKDQFCVGFFRDMTWHGRYNIVDDTGCLFRHNGFRRAEKISAEEGALVVENAKEIEEKGYGVWDFIKGNVFELYPKQQGE